MADQVLLLLMKSKFLIGASLSESHTNDKDDTGIVFTKIYIEIWINGKSVMRSYNVFNCCYDRIKCV